MATPTHRAPDVWALVRAQHGVIARAQLLALGLTPAAIRQRRLNGRLHEVHRGIYAVGRRELDRYGELMAAVLACGPGAQLSHQSAAELWRMRGRVDRPIDVAVSGDVPRRRPGITIHRCRHHHRRYLHRIPVGDPISVLVDLAAELSTDEVEDAVNEADRLDLIRTHRLRPALDKEPKRPGVGRLKRILDAQTFSRAANALERRFLAIVRSAGLPPPDTQGRLGRYRVDFFWPDLGLVVETDSLRHHRTAAEQTVDLGRDQAHARAGLRTVRFTHSQVFHRPDHVAAVLTDTFRHLVTAIA
ncbi:MAG TPA: type IV toxin-antitoxin system AbiEi family antitoxin domain-containing protein [Solirubrobacterales bacterium]|jgi:very-short-patch-repair endonuclease